MNAPFRLDPGVLDVAIIGAGFSGLCMAIKLKQAGRTNFRVFEKASDIGGTWFLNRYPGCACDVPSHLYSFSFDQNPSWSRAYSPAEEIWRYQKASAEKHGILPFIRCNAEVARAQYDEAAQLWRLTLKNGESFAARALVAGAGILHVPFTPQIAGAESFAGKTLHTAEWDDSYDLRAKRVAVIGTGASAIQLVPAIAGKVAHLDLYQRTPGWVIPRLDHAFEEQAKARFQRWPWLQRLFRGVIYWRAEMLAFGFTRSRKMMAGFQKVAQAELEKAVPDPALRAKLTPDFPIGCKRVLISNDFYPAVQRDNVDLVTDAIARITPAGIVTADGTERACDAIIYATGFRVTDWLSHVDIRGRGGRKLIDDWKDGAAAYYGVAVNGYPNMFLLLGPNTGLGHNSVVFMIESQVRFAMGCLGWLWSGAGAVEVKKAVEEAFNAALHEKMKRTVWMSGCKSWYLNPNGTNSTLWPDFTVSYWWQTRRARKRDFELTPARAPAVQVS
ncbi:MAG: NAD(P)/FAD-dependent oxidoreductase [Alphaproteobacteria bacterium]|nr:NAD(P)/FAD-dependent oxidoreductase [Alphaproteobacteria bacterium]MBV9694542.1 NAD(P)/FAD-dependent oxidoreductase [Alphaproteobacteria bacterium]